MKLLVVTQVVDNNDTNLGFFHVWLEKLAAHVDHLTVICLKKGEYRLPSNVTILSLGKESGSSRWRRIINFYHLSFIAYHKQYDQVFIHMNPEYAVLGGPFWRITGKKVLLWYTHKAVNWRLRLAAVFANKIFTASPESCRLKSWKVEVVGHGIPVDAFPSRGDVEEGDPIRFLSVARISSVKDLETVILAVAELKKRVHQPLLLDIVGDAITAQDKEYEKTLAELVSHLGLQDTVHFLGGKTHDHMKAIYADHDVLLHTSKTGSIDKVVLEALAAGLAVFTTSEAYGGFEEVLVRVPGNNAKKLAEAIEKNLEFAILKRNDAGMEFVKKHYDLNRLIEKIIWYFNT